MTSLPRPYARPLAAAASLAALWAMAACASAPVPDEQLALSRAAIVQAVAAGAPELAPAEMGMARDKMARAEQAVTAKEPARALTLAQQAQADAQLAEAKAQALKSRRAADALQEASRALREEMARQTPNNMPRN